MRRKLSLVFFVLYLLVFGLLPARRWWDNSTIYFTWTMYASGSGKPGRGLGIELFDPDGDAVPLRILQGRPFAYVYGPGQGPASAGQPSANHLFRTVVRTPLAPELAKQVCARFPGAASVEISVEFSDPVRFACP